MAEETPIEVSAQKLIDTKLSLSEILSNNWKDNCIFSSVEAALKDEEIKSLDEGEEILPSEATTDLERFVVEANAIFHKNNSPYHAKLISFRRITDQEGRQKVLIVGKIGKDTFYQIAQYAITFTHKSGERVIAWIPDNFGLISQKTGSVFRFDCLPLIKTKYKSQEVMFMEIAGRKHRANFMSIKTSQNETGEMFRESNTLTFLPENFRDMGVFLHELGHMLRDKAINNNSELKNGDREAYNQFQKILESGLPFNPQAAISPYQTRKIKANEERGAWAIGISLIREVGKIK